MIIEFKAKEIEADHQGYLLKVEDWNEEIAVILADQENIKLSDPHWEVIHFVRNFYLKFKVSPAIRVLVNAMKEKLGKDKGNSRYLYKLFPKGPAKQATKIAGLPKPTKCI